jgi:hypothetical protein
MLLIFNGVDKENLSGFFLQRGRTAAESRPKEQGSIAAL